MTRLGRTAFALGVLALLALQAAPSPAATPTIGKVVMNGPDPPDPNNPLNFNFEIKNLSQNSTKGPKQIDWLLIDCHRARNGKSLYAGDVIAPSIVPPPGMFGNLTVQYEGATIAMTATDFDAQEQAQFDIDPDSWEDTAVIKRKDFAGCRVELVFYLTSLRAAGTLKLDGSKVVGSLKQTNP